MLEPAPKPAPTLRRSLLILPDRAPAAPARTISRTSSRWSAPASLPCPWDILAVSRGLPASGRGDSRPGRTGQGQDTISASSWNTRLNTTHPAACAPTQPGTRPARRRARGTTPTGSRCMDASLARRRARGTTPARPLPAPEHSSASANAVFCSGPGTRPAPARNDKARTCRAPSLPSCSSWPACRTIGFERFSRLVGCQHLPTIGHFRT
jgi:hypothetical protein